MPAQPMISREDADDLKGRINWMVDQLEAAGFERVMIASAMLGIGLGMRAAICGVDDTLEGLDGLRAVLLKSDGKLN